MKKILSIIGAGILLMGGVISTALLTSPKDINEAKADTVRTAYSGLFERIEDGSEVTPGTQVIIATTRGYVFDGVGGNPAYAHADPGGVTMFPSYDSSKSDYEQDDTKFIYLHNKTAVMLTAEAGSTDYDSSLGYVSFKSAFIIDGKQYNHYLGENDEENYNQRNDYDTIGWFLDGFGIRKTKDGKSTWELEYDSENKRMKMRKVLYDDETSYLCYAYGTARHHFNFGGLDRAWINLYRKVSDENIVRSFEPTVNHEMNKSEYHKGETIEYDGLVVEFRIKRGETLYDSYYLKYDDDTRSFFSSPITVSDTTVTDTGFAKQIYIQVYIREVGFIQYVHEITIPSSASNNVYNEVTSLPSDLRGTYLLVTVSNLRVLNASQGAGTTNNFTAKENAFSDHYITTDSERLDESIIKIVRTKISDTYYYHAMNYLGKYLCIGSDKPFSEKDEYYLDYSDTATVSNAITITSNSLMIGDYYLNGEEGGMKLICFTKVYEQMGLFKLSSSTSSVASQVNGFISYFESETLVCENADETENVFDKISDEFWGNIEEEFNKLSCDAQGIFASTTYTHNTETEGTKENVVDRYDYIISKYHKKDFMLRGLANTYENNFSSSSLKMLNNKDTTVAIIVIAISVTIIGTTLGLFILKKRKYN